MSVALGNFSRWDRILLNLSSKLSEPFCETCHLLCYRLFAPLLPGKFHFCDSKIKEIAMRSFIALGLILASVITCEIPLLIFSSILGLGFTRMTLRALGFTLQKGGYTHVKGLASEKQLAPDCHEATALTWNLCGPGPLSPTNGGVPHWRYRFKLFLAEIKKKDPDLIILQEIYDTELAEQLIQSLKNTYAHFFIHLGPNILGSVSGFAIISKIDLKNFSYTPFSNNDWSLNRGFASWQVKNIQMIGTHLIHGDGEKNHQKRMKQVGEIIDHIRRSKLPTILAGDLNVERDAKEPNLLSQHFTHGYTKNEPTCTNRLTAQWTQKKAFPPDETIDYVSEFHELGEPSTQIIQKCELVRAFDSSYNTKTALSDHHGLFVALRI